MNILESFSLGKCGIDLRNEDAYFINENFICVIDGASSKTDRIYDGKKTGKICTDLILEQLANINGRVCAEELFQSLYENISKWYQNQSNPLSFFENPEQRVSASIAVYSKYHQSIWVVGDIMVLIDQVEFRHDLAVDQLYIDIRQKAYNFFDALGISYSQLTEDDLTTKLIRPLMGYQNALQNARESPLGYPIINGIDALPMSYKDYPVKEGQEICLITDGYPKAFSTLAKAEEYLQRILVEDPLGLKLFKHPIGKHHDLLSYDDRTYVRFIV